MSVAKKGRRTRRVLLAVLLLMLGLAGWALLGPPSRIIKATLGAARAAPDLLRASSFLLVAQNNDELRASGGFITGAGLVHIEKSRIAGMSFMDSYAVDDLGQYYPDPPQPLYDYMLAEQWLFRDSNWSPDFPSAARQMAEFYQLGTGQVVEGVVSLDMPALQLIVDAMGPLSLPGVSEPIDGGNVVEWMRQERGGIEAGQGLGEWWQGRKDFMGPLAAALKDKLLAGQVDWLKLARAGLQGLRSKHIQVYLQNPQAQALLEALGWDGAVRAAPGDYLLVVDSNVGFNKANAVVEQSIVYEVWLAADGSAEVELTIQYRNASAGEAGCDPSPRYGKDYQEDIQRCYWDYLRVYLPEGAQLQSFTPAPLPAESLAHLKLDRPLEETLIGSSDLGKRVYGLYFLLRRGQERGQTFRYALSGLAAEKSDDWVYSLLWQKQAGTSSFLVELRLHLPEGATLRGSKPAPDEQRGGLLVYRWVLDQDRRLRVRYR